VSYIQGYVLELKSQTKKHSTENG